MKTFKPDTLKANTFKTNTFNLSSAAIFACATLSANAATQTDQHKIKADETIVVTGNRSEQPLDSVLASMTILDRTDIELIQPKSLADLLEHVNGLDITYSGGAGQASSVFSRGTDSNHTLVLINGQRIGLANFDSVNFNNIPVAQIERIEVIKGPRAALYGSDAIGGVIQIFTRELDHSQYYVNLAGGSDSFRQLDLAMGAQHGNGQSTLSLSGEKSDGFDVKDDGETDKDGYDKLSFALNGSQQLTEVASLNWLARVDSGNTEFDSTWGGNETDFEQQIYKLGTNIELDSSQHQFSIARATEESDTFNAEVDSPADHYKTTRDQVSWLSGIDFTQELSAAAGIDIYKEKITTDSAFSQVKDDRVTRGYFTNLNYQDQLLILQGAVRYDDIDGIGSNTSLSFSGGVHATDKLLISLSYGEGFKAPSFYDLSQSSELTAEDSQSFELLLRSNYFGIKSELSFYKTDIDNLIEYNSSDWKPYNVAEADIQGAELSIAAHYLGLEHQLNYSYLDAKNGQTNDPLLRRARHKANYQLSYQWQELQLALDYQYRGKRTDNNFNTFPATVVEMEDYSLLDISLNYQLDKQWKVQFKASNIADVNYQSINSYFTRGAEYFVNISYANF